MSSYMIDNKTSNIYNALVMDITPCDKDTRNENAIDCTDKFIAAGFNLPENNFLGWEFALDKNGIPGTVAFSSPTAGVSRGDYKWIFEECLKINTGNSAEMQDYFCENRKVYAICIKDPGCDQKASIYFDLKYDCLMNGKDLTNCSNLLKVLKSVGGAYIRVYVNGSGDEDNAGSILISLPEELSLRLRTVLCTMFPFTDIKEISKDMKKEEYTLHENYIGTCLRGLLYSLMTCNTADDLFIFDNDTEIEQAPPELAYNTPIKDLGLRPRAVISLTRAGITTFGKLKALSDDDLIRVRNLGRPSYLQVKQKCAAFRLAGEVAPITSENSQARLDELIGLENVKEQIDKITSYAKMKQDMAKAGIPGKALSLNMAFWGNPGTAKTTVARILAGIFHDIGLLASPAVIDVGRADLVGRYVGHTADNVKSVFSRARGKLLFIDEAYSLVDGWENSYGDEAIDTIVREMENHRDETIVIFAGYPKEMDEFFDRNPGLRSRVPFKINFKDYSPEEMERIVELEAGKRGFSIHDRAKSRIIELCARASSCVNAGNGRFSRNLAENAIIEYAARVYGKDGAKDGSGFVLEARDFKAEILPEEENVSIPLGFQVG